jgi:hypothetical protein
MTKKTRETMKFRLIAAAAAACVFASAAQAAVGDVYFQAGTQGVGVGYAQPLTSWLGLHADVNGFGLSHTFGAGDNDYAAHLHLFSAGTYVDLFPIPSSGFRLTAGVLFDDSYATGNAVSENGTYNINGTSYSAPGATISAKVKYPSVMPYVGLGYGHKPTQTKGFGFTADVGVAFGTPHVDYNVSPDLVAIAGQDNVNAEEQRVRDSVRRDRFYPIVQVGITYRFN